MSSFVRKKVIQEYYSKRSKNYDKQKRRTWKSGKGFDDEIVDTIVGAVRVSENSVVLEVCVGTGRTSLPLLKRVETHLVGLDLSKEMLKTAKEKMSSCKKRFDLVLGDAEHLPFKEEIFDAVICTSAMHYFTDPDQYLARFSRVLKEKGSFVYGDLTLHESDELGFLNRLERTVSHAHESYMKPSEAKTMLENQGFDVCEMRTFAYRKPIDYLMEDKGSYFGVKPQALHELLQTASENERNLYSADGNELTLYYTIITAVKESSA
jgi:ubiquinone/menaquinone biosynthesis C-methylase UbiE